MVAIHVDGRSPVGGWLRYAPGAGPEHGSQPVVAIGLFEGSVGSARGRSRLFRFQAGCRSCRVTWFWEVLRFYLAQTTQALF